MRLGNPIPCPEPFTWLPEAVEKRLAALVKAGEVPVAGQRQEHTQASVVRELLWSQLAKLDKELAASRVSMRPRATVAGDKRAPRIVAYNLVGEFVTIPARLTAAADALNAIEPKRFAKALQALAKAASESDSLDDLYSSRIEPEGMPHRVGVQVAFTIDSRTPRVRELIDDVTNFAPTWSSSSLARELLARELAEHAPKNWLKWRRPGLPQMRYR